MRLVIAPSANLDLVEIGVHLVTVNPAAAEKLLRTLREKFDLLASFPNIGKARDELVINLRSFPVGDYVIFYQVYDDQLEIVRVRHAATDVDRLFDNP